MTDNDRISGVWDNMSERQIQAVSYKLANPEARYSDIEEELSIPTGTLNRWGLNSLVAEVRKDMAQSIVDYAKRASLRAIRLLENQMDSEDQRIAQNAAKELLDRFMGKATQRNEHTGKDGNAISIEFTYPDDDEEN